MVRGEMKQTGSTRMNKTIHMFTWRFAFFVLNREKYLMFKQCQNEIIYTCSAFQESTTLTPAFKTISSSSMSGGQCIFYL